MTPGTRKKALLAGSAVLLAITAVLVGTLIITARRVARVDALVKDLTFYWESQDHEWQADAAREELADCRHRCEIDRLIYHLGHTRSDGVLAWVPDILVRIGEPAVAPVADALLAALQPQSRGFWTVVLERLNREPHNGLPVDELVELARALGDPVTDRLIAASRSKRVRRRAAAAEALAWIGGDKARAAALALLDDPSAVVRRQLAWGLGLGCDASAVPGLVRLARDPDYYVAGAADAAFTDLYSAPGASAALAPLLSDTTLPVLARVCVIGTLANARDLSAFDAIAAFLHHPNGDIRRAAVSALPNLDEARACAPLAAALLDSDPDVAQGAGSYFWKAVCPSVVETLLSTYAVTSGPDDRAIVRKALIGVRDGRHHGYRDDGPPPADLVAKLRADASAALASIDAGQVPSPPSLEATSPL